MKITIDIEKVELDALKRIYQKKGLKEKWAGNNPAPEDVVVKKIVEAAQKSEK
jgi:hypothetical protein